MTFRAVKVLEEADVIAAEDTRRTKILLERYNIHKKLTSYHAFNEHHKTESLLGMVSDGKKLAVVTDAGTPCVADPGFLLVREALKKGIEPVIIPGVSSLTFSIAASGAPMDRFVFSGFLPVKSGRRTEALREISEEKRSVIIFESPHRMEKLLNEIGEYCGGETKLSVIREATKVHEEILRGSVSEIIERTKGRAWKGECVVVISKKIKKDDDDE